jgi:hypothetical protein
MVKSQVNRGTNGPLGNGAKAIVNADMKQSATATKRQTNNRSEYGTSGVAFGGFYVKYVCSMCVVYV